MATANERFKQMRLALGLTQKGIAELIGMTHASFSQIEQGTRSVTERLAKIANWRFGLNEHWLWTGEGEMFLDRATKLQSLLEDTYQLTPNEAAMITDIVCSTPDERRKLCDAVSVFIRGMRA